MSYRFMRIIVFFDLPTITLKIKDNIEILEIF